MTHVDRGHFGCGRQQVVHEARRHESSVLVVDEPLEQGAADALRDPALDLPVDDHRVHDLAAVLDHHVSQQMYCARGRVEFHVRGVDRGGRTNRAPGA